MFKQTTDNLGAIYGVPALLFTIAKLRVAELQRFFISLTNADQAKKFQTIVN